MAIGGLISNRNFGSFIGSGKLCRGEQAILLHRGERSAVAVVHGKMLYRKLCSQTANGFISGYSFGPFLQTTVHLDENTLKPISISRNGRQPISSLSLHHSEKSHRVYPQQRSRGSFGCYSSSSPSLGRWLEPGDEDRIRKNRTRAYYKSEEYDITEAKVDPLPSPEATNEVVLVEGEMQEAVPWWQSFPKRWFIVLLCFAAFLLCNMDRVNMSIAILPMSKEFNWNSATVGLIQSSFFWGYLLTQILGGIWADKFGGKLVLGFGVIWWSVATILTPIAARIGLPFLLTMRAFMGIGEGVAMPAMNNLLSKWIPVSERSRSLALVYSGMYLGSVTGLAFSPILIHKFGWPSVFYSFGSLGSIWFALWLRKAYSSPNEDPKLSKEEKKLIMGGSISKEPVKIIPWRLILSKAPVWALIISHFCHNWGTFILLTWMPTYYNQVKIIDSCCLAHVALLAMRHAVYMAPCSFTGCTDVAAHAFPMAYTLACQKFMPVVLGNRFTDH
ncbi:PREDICTED: ascorbate transporter, chloroplastic isoform X3 [Theobroma cacao]|uniref:Ascorbate transporter, chloroplastic isoform X3 n=1 Tax=Theobroma cacao TaxID=3641 RepID=A0AB32WIP9_THECC|nr:PREDICTED: ascorbate transporter, chloroplastic isoform X3 [Theobroma cacao]